MSEVLSSSAEFLEKTWSEIRNVALRQNVLPDESITKFISSIQWMNLKLLVKYRISLKMPTMGLPAGKPGILFLVITKIIISETIYDFFSCSTISSQVYTNTTVSENSAACFFIRLPHYPENSSRNNINTNSDKQLYKHVTLNYIPRQEVRVKRYCRQEECRLTEFTSLLR